MKKSLKKNTINYLSPITQEKKMKITLLNPHAIYKSQKQISCKKIYKIF